MDGDLAGGISNRYGGAAGIGNRWKASMKPTFVLVVASMLAAACNEPVLRTQTPGASSVSLSITKLDVVDGSTEATVQAFVRDKNGILLFGIPIKWSHSCDAPNFSREEYVTVTTSGDTARIRGIVPHVRCVISAEANGVTAELNISL